MSHNHFLSFSESLTNLCTEVQQLHGRSGPHGQAEVLLRRGKDRPPLVEVCVLWDHEHWRNQCSDPLDPRPLPANEGLFSLKSFKMKLIHDLADDFISASQPQEGPSTQTVSDYVVREDMVDGHQLIHGRKQVCRVCSSQKRKIRKMLKRTCQKGNRHKLM